MNVVVAYVYPLSLARTHFPMAKRFADTYRAYAAGYEHSLLILENGGALPETMLRPFEGLVYGVLEHSNYGWDIGAYQKAAATVKCDFLVCLGAHIHFNHENWLLSLVEACVQHGPGLYGPFAALYPNPHIRTTAFACQPEILNSYPYPVTSERASRYQFEHGRRSLTAMAVGAGFPAVMVTRKGTWPYPNWPDEAMPDKEASIMLDKQHA